jgi:hypothetical protein
LTDYGHSNAATAIADKLIRSQMDREKAIAAPTMSAIIAVHNGILPSIGGRGTMGPYKTRDLITISGVRY